MATHIADFNDMMKKMMAGEIPPPPIAALIGFRPTSCGDGKAEFVLDVDQRLFNPMGTLHGGVIVDLADASMGTALASTIEPGTTYTTIELHTNYFKPVRSGRITAKSKIVKKTKSIAVVECDVVDESNSLVARVSSTCMILRGEQAAGR